MASPADADPGASPLVRGRRLATRSVRFGLVGSSLGLWRGRLAVDRTGGIFAVVRRSGAN
jgi:hypothetical protein